MSNGSRLNQMQARFQQKQLEEKEQKLVRLYETQQAHALKRVGGTSTTTQNTGKVRQMFEERRTKAGIDKSYPLQPLGLNSKTSSKHSTGGGAVVTKTSSMKNGYHTTSYKATNQHEANGHSIRQEVTMEVRQKSNDLPSLNKSHNRFDSDRILKDQNLNDEFLDDVSFPDGFELLSLETVNNKLPNVGGKLPSEKQAAKLKENNNNIIMSRSDSKKPFESVRMNGDNNSRVKVSPLAKKTTSNVKPLMKPSSPASSVGSSTPKTSQHSSPMTVQIPTPKARTPVEKVQETNRTPLKKTPSPTPVMSKTPQKKVSPPESPDKTGSTATCKICSRRFAPDRLDKHQSICAKTASKKRKPYDPIKHRIEGTDVAAYVKVQRKGNQVVAIPKSGPVKLKPSNWRKKHEEFIRTIRAAKEAQAYVEKGGKLSDLPPPPPSENPDYVQCPHCSRRFNQQAADRHIPKCATFQFNKSKNQPAKKR